MSHGTPSKIWSSVFVLFWGKVEGTRMSLHSDTWDLGGSVFLFDSITSLCYLQTRLEP